jgi:hypothetical protein
MQDNDNLRATSSHGENAQPALSELEKIDLQIECAINAIINKKPDNMPDSPAAYRRLIDKIIDLDFQHGEQAALSRKMETIMRCHTTGPAHHFAQKPTALSEILSLKSASFQTDRRQAFPDLLPYQSTLLREFASEWDKNVVPHLVKRAEIMGVEQLVAGGLKRMVHEWFSTNHDNFAMLAWKDKSFDSDFVRPQFIDLIKHLQFFNTNDECSKSLKLVLDDISPDRHDPVALSKHMDAISTYFDVDAAHITPENMQELRHIFGRIGWHSEQLKESPSKRALMDLSRHYLELVNAPYSAVRGYVPSHSR